jgi:selenocysteine lyase/cysteine desulfurase
MHERGIDGFVRASVHAFNTEEEINEFAAAMRVIA